MTCKIDEVDERILKDLLCDGRKSFATIGEECGVSTNVVRKRYTTMKRKGIIVGATVQMNYDPFGYPAIATILLNVESQHLENTFENMRKIPSVLAIRQFNSRYAIRLIAKLHNLKELDRIRDAIRRHRAVNDLRTYFWLDVKNQPENLALSLRECGDKTPAAKLQRNSGVKEIAIDELDKKVMEELARNGRESFRRISQRTGISTDTVIRRYERLKESGAAKVSIQIDPEKLGFQANLDFSIAFAFQKDTAAIVETLANTPNVIIIIKTSGDFDLHVTAMVKDTKQQFEIQEEIEKIPNIAKIETAARRIPNVWPTERQHISTF